MTRACGWGGTVCVARSGAGSVCRSGCTAWFDEAGGVSPSAAGGSMGWKASEIRDGDGRCASVLIPPPFRFTFADGSPFGAGPFATACPSL